MKSALRRRGIAVRRSVLTRLNAGVLSLCVFSVSAQELPMKNRLHVNSGIATAILVDNATARDFAALLPLSLALVEFAKVERIGDLPRKLSTAGAPAIRV